MLYSESLTLEPIANILSVYHVVAMCVYFNGSIIHVQIL